MLPAVWSHLDPAITYLTINGDVIETTPNHPFYSAAGWIEAGALAVGDRILALDGDYGAVMREQMMYDLTVEDAHTFAVGAGAWVVHNEGLCTPAQVIQAMRDNGVIRIPSDVITRLNTIVHNNPNADFAPLREMAFNPASLPNPEKTHFLILAVCFAVLAPRGATCK